MRIRPAACVKPMRRSGSIAMIVLMCVLLVLQYKQLKAFESSDLGYLKGYRSHDDHGQITREALDSAGYSSVCRETVATANTHVDLYETESFEHLETGIVLHSPLLVTYFSAHHFDRNDIQHGKPFVNGFLK